MHNRVSTDTDLHGSAYFFADSYIAFTCIMVAYCSKALVVSRIA